MLHLADFGMPTNGMVMIHKPSGVFEGNEDQVLAEVEGLKKLTQQYRASYAKAMRKTEADVEALWGKGDVWLTAQEAKDMGLVVRITDAANGPRAAIAVGTAPGNVAVVRYGTSDGGGTGQVVTILPGCGRQYARDCGTKFANQANFRGEPFMPDFIEQRDPGAPKTPKK
jgi:hypothetical protein